MVQGSFQGYFSSTENACAVPTCTTASVTTPVYGEVTISVRSSQAQGQPDLPVYVFNGTTYSGLSGVTGADGTVTLWIPAGSYRFRADQFDLQFFSSDENHCTVPECTTAVVNTLGMQQVEVNQTIDYTYDPLNRLTSAVYDDGSFYQYTYDAVGNRLTETTPSGTDTYIYNINNWVVQKNDTHWSYDGAGNLRYDGVRSYAYDAANRLQLVSDQSAYIQTRYVYNGLGDRLQSMLIYYPTGEITTNNYTLDLNTNLTQVLADGSNTYTYGYNRIAQISDTQTGYFLGDALGSVRQVADETGAVNLVQSYSPYGEMIASVGDYVTAFNYTGEMTDGTGLVFLRARYYDPSSGRFINKDTWGGDYNNPITLAKWLYANGNPANYSDPTGFCSQPLSSTNLCWSTLLRIEGKYRFIDLETDIDKNNFWTNEELIVIENDLGYLHQASNSSLYTFFTDYVRLKRERIDVPVGNGYKTAKTYRYWTSDRPILFYNHFNSGDLIHELAHYIDFTQLDASKSFEKYVGASTFLWWYDPGKESPPIYAGTNPPNRVEDFAASFEEYVQITTGFSQNSIGIKVEEKRWNFIKALLGTGEILQSENEDDCINNFPILPS